MIAPKSGPEPASVRETTERFFRPGGIMEKACRGGDFPYEPRPQQLEMSLAVADALEEGKHLAVEAGTGVGKSFAYLVPLILTALARQVQVVVSTYTIGLQEQLIAKDIPFLQRHLGCDFKAVLVKGRSNYLCLRRLARAGRMEDELFKSRQLEDLDRIRTWAAQTSDGSVQELEEQPSPDVWGLVSVEHGNCMWQRCPEYSQCFLMKARARIRDAQLLVVNHHLFFSDLALRQHGAAILPDAGVAVLDEAHQVEKAASEHLGVRLSQYGFEHWLRRLFVPDTSKGMLAALKAGQAAHLVTRLWEAVPAFFEEVRSRAGVEGPVTQRTVPAPLDLESPIVSMIAQVNACLRVLHDEQEDLDLRAELSAARRRGAEMRDALESFLKQSFNDHVYWVELEGARRKQTVLYSAPVEIGPPLKAMLFDSLSSVIMTSATLAVQDNFDFFKARVGAEDARALSVGSPFNFERQMKVVIPGGMPDPNDTEAYTAATIEAVKRYAERTKGRAFVLFTNARFMRDVAEGLRDHFADNGYTLFVQGEGLSRHLMLEKFRKVKRGVLFGLDSFWMGVDVRGEALSNVIITKLPFAVPDEPVVKARMDRIKSKGGDPFRDYSLPEAILKFRQGVGRLIRSATDEGIVVVLDPRVRSKWYGKYFLQSIPECPWEEGEGV
jgi:ATP-dependent DNA helicase DinG